MGRLPKVGGKQLEPSCPPSEAPKASVQAEKAETTPCQSRRNARVACTLFPIVEGTYGLLAESVGGILDVVALSWTFSEMAASGTEMNHVAPMIIIKKKINNWNWFQRASQPALQLLRDPHGSGFQFKKEMPDFAAEKGVTKDPGRTFLEFEAYESLFPKRSPTRSRAPGTHRAGRFEPPRDVWP